MAKSYHLKEIIELETSSPYLTSLPNFIWDQLTAKNYPPPFRRHPLDEMAIWQAALQLDKPLANHGGRGQ